MFGALPLGLGGTQAGTKANGHHNVNLSKLTKIEREELGP